MKTYLYAFCILSLMSATSCKKKEDFSPGKKLVALEVFLEPSNDLFGKNGGLYINDKPAVVFFYSGMVPSLNLTTGTYKLKAHVADFEPAEMEVVIDEDSEDPTQVYFDLVPVR